VYSIVASTAHHCFVKLSSADYLSAFEHIPPRSGGDAVAHFPVTRAVDVIARQSFANDKFQKAIVSQGRIQQFFQAIQK